MVDIKPLALALVLVVVSAPTGNAQVGRSPDASRLGDPHAAAPASPRFRTGVDLVPLDVCVRARSGEPAAGLTPNEFLVLENNVPQEIAFFATEGRVRLAVSLLIDVSQSMAGPRLERARAAAAEFLDTLRPDDLVEVISFNERATVLYPLGPDHNRATLALADLSSSGATGLFEAVLVALRRLGRAEHIPHAEYRDVMIVISDGDDTSSRPSFDDVLEDVRRSSVILYSISLQDDASDRLAAPHWSMGQLAHDTGGRAVAVRDPENLADVYREIGLELLHLYRLAYVPSSPNPGGKWRTVSVRVPDRDVVVRTRSGYYAPRHSSTPRKTTGR